jgi:hypothetical protein
MSFAKSIAKILYYIKDTKAISFISSLVTSLLIYIIANALINLIAYARLYFAIYDISFPRQAY